MASRHDITTEVMLNIINPEETFTPKFVNAELQEISEKAIRLRTHELDKDECESLLKTRYLAKITLGASFLPKPLSLKADIFWAKYVPATATTPHSSDLGFNLRAPEEMDRIALRLLIRTLDEIKANQTK
ncbi:hypothetical protein KQI84_12580 [bacterium]|nr:hypothetical protein [bacterium]